MADVALIWYTLDDTTVLCSREEVRAWAEELKLPPGPLSRRSPATTFIATCEQTELVYGDPTGSRTVRGRLSGRKDDWVAFDALRDDGLRLGQLKLFMPRRTAVGVVPDSYKVKAAHRDELDLHAVLAVKEWLALAEAEFHRRQAEVPWYQVRRMARALLLEVAVPVRRRTSMFFAYAPDLDFVERSATFLRRAAPDADIVVLPLHPDADVSGLVASADEFLLEGRVHDLVALIEKWVSRADSSRPHLKGQLTRWRVIAGSIATLIQTHEDRLGHGLPRARAGLVMAEEMIAAMDPTAHLQRVRTR